MNFSVQKKLENLVLDGIEGISIRNSSKKITRDELVNTIFEIFTRFYPQVRIKGKFLEVGEEDQVVYNLSVSDRNIPGFSNIIIYEYDSIFSLHKN